MKKYELITLSIFSVLLIGESLFGFSRQIYQNNTSISSQQEEIKEEIMVDNKIIKLKNIGDTCILKAEVDKNATVKSVTFYSSNEAAVQIIKNGTSSCILKKVSMFSGFITITAYSDDPYHTIFARCNVRSYNSVTDIQEFFATAIDTDGSIRDGLSTESGSDRIIIRNGLTYECGFDLFTYNGQNYLEHVSGTYYGIEEEDFLELKNSIQTMLGENELISFTNLSENTDQYEYSESHTIHFSFKFKNPIYEGSSSEKSFGCNNITHKIRFETYVGTSEIIIINPPVAI